jgi:exoribonuclease R
MKKSRNLLGNFPLESLRNLSLLEPSWASRGTGVLIAGPFSLMLSTYIFYNLFSFFRYSFGEGLNHTFVPSDKNIPRIKIRTRQGAQLLGKRLVASIDDWAKNSRYPFGHFVRRSGELGDRDTENKVILIEQSVPYYFSAIIYYLVSRSPRGVCRRRSFLPL